MVSFLRAKYKYILYIIWAVASIVFTALALYFFAEYKKQLSLNTELQGQVADINRQLVDMQEKRDFLSAIINRDRILIQDFFKNYEVMDSEVRLIFDNMNKCVGNVTEELIQECRTAQELHKIHNDNYTNLKEKNIKLIEEINKTDK